MLSKEKREALENHVKCCDASELISSLDFITDEYVRRYSEHDEALKNSKLSTHTLVKSQVDYGDDCGFCGGNAETSSRLGSHIEELDDEIEKFCDDLAEVISEFKEEISKIKKEYSK